MKKKERLKAFLGEGTSFEGKLCFEDTIEISGYFKGDISSSGKLIVGNKGVIESNIHVKSAQISGEVHGTIVAEKLIEFIVPGKMFGDIQAPTVVIQKGVILEGHCRTISNPTEPSDVHTVTILDDKKKKK